jgi:predicted transcriptional regulator of viral defense system
MTKEDIVIEMIKNKGVLRPKELEEAGVSRMILSRMYKKKLIEKLGRGLYCLPDSLYSAHVSLAEVSKRVSSAVISLLSALSYHEITTQLPHSVWITLPKSSWTPRIENLTLECTYVSGEAYSYGIEEHDISGVIVKIYSPARTVADCFKFRSKVGIDVAVEALKDVINQNKASVNDIVEASMICKVWKIVKPYLEAIIA